MNNLLSTLYPIGSIYIGTQNSCPLTALIHGSVWQIVGTNRALWGGNGSNANSIIDAGLPNITGTFKDNGHAGALAATGAFTGAKDGAGSNSGWAGDGGTYTFNASRSNSIYGKSNTVQPPAYIVNVWIRTA